MRLGKQKLTALMILLGCVVVLAVARWLEPDPRGFGTHEQLRLPPCLFQRATGLPCVTCGMTTAVAYGVRGDVRHAFVTQPFGLVVLLCAVVLALDSLLALTTNRSLRNLSLPWKKICLALVGLLLLAWGYKIAMAVG